MREKKLQENGKKLYKYEIHIMQVFSSPNIIISAKLYCGTCNEGGGGGWKSPKYLNRKI